MLKKVVEMTSGIGMIVGMPTLIELPDIRDNFELCKELGLDFIEINMNLPQYQIDSFPVKKCRDLMCESGISLTIHLDENLNVCDFNAAVADAYLGTVINTIQIAKKLSVPVINMHLSDGVYFTLPNEKVYLFEKYNDYYIDKLNNFRTKCKDTIGDSDILICIENCGALQNFQKSAIELLLQSPHFGLTYDIGHDYVAKNTNENFILSHVERLKHMHIHDATRTQNHMVLGSGEIDIKEKLTLAQQNHCSCVLETKTIAGLRQSVDFLRETGYHQPL